MTDIRVLLLHGFVHHRPSGHWLWWLGEQLRLARIPVQYPQLPGPDAPRLADQHEVLLGELEMLGDGERVVITHSLGGVLWLHAAMGLDGAGLDPRLRVDRVLMVAPPHPSRLVGPLGDMALPARLEDAAARASRETAILARETDDYRPAPLTELAEAWGVPAVTLPGSGHLNVDDGHGPWQTMLDWVTDPAVEWRLGDGAHSLGS
ncbi:alpha/beta fold hydrolase [Demequina sp. SYSU T00039]|uniref:Alpha/beta fold hydrolase n=1 Tax=Demequina lignilytica TaxID=3051663 RepID=A0AAW7M8R2_9MICO|nr:MULTISPECIES: alpha/beta hydrolase [unclassified Demequina]MDN4477722.1 alpha/beta fold hydrolase [Demequina sp. SYSU T00039-1]MDN4487631.1 alpha/beta fold hydrolase [Demequina sp. SYSU T00039]MDN4491342.1 alpha/beta fold hydrolase [Demequina sp. SYSU T00068]